jgi:hypothetical protein
VTDTLFHILEFINLLNSLTGHHYTAFAQTCSFQCLEFCNHCCIVHLSHVVVHHMARYFLIPSINITCSIYCDTTQVASTYWQHPGPWVHQWTRKP